VKLGSSITISAGALLAIGVAGWLLATCARRDGIAIGKQLVHDQAVDSTNTAHAATDSLANATWRVRLDSLARANTAARALPRLEHRADSAARAIAAIPDSFVPKSQALAALGAEHQVSDSLRHVVVQDSAGIRARDNRILALMRSDSIYAHVTVPQLTKDRDWWKKRASSPCGLGGAVGLGIRGADAVAGFTCRISLPRLF
jgi:hypothetical protein